MTRAGGRPSWSRFGLRAAGLPLTVAADLRRRQNQLVDPAIEVVHMRTDFFGPGSIAGLGLGGACDDIRVLDLIHRHVFRLAIHG
jgi:hypothetical protein